jgi:hypothetical protein
MGPLGEQECNANRNPRKARDRNCTDEALGSSK